MKRRTFILALSIGMQPVCATVAVPQQLPDVRPAHHYAVHVTDAAQRFGIPESWIWAVMRIESHGDAHAVSSAGAQGLMQIMPATWTTLRARYALGADPFDPRDNIMAGAAYLREMHDRYGNAAAMLAAYNVGPGRYDQYLSHGRPLPGETRAYLAKLAPMMGGSGDVQLATAPLPDPFAWRRVVLFVRTANVAERASTASADDDSASVEPVISVPMESGSNTSETAADMLFVRLSGTDRPR